MDIYLNVVHGLLLVAQGYVIAVLHKNGIKFDIRIWRNGDKRENSTKNPSS